MSEKIRDEHTDLFVDALLSVKTPEEMYSFLEDICTIQELKSMAQRLAVAVLLKKDTPYNDIVNKTGVSTATISRVNRCLQYGADGYTKVLENLEKSGKLQ